MDLNILTDEMIKEAIQKDAHSSFGDHIAGIVLVIILGIVLLKFFGGNLLDCIYFKDKKPIIYYIIHILLISFGVFLLVFSSNEISFLIHHDNYNNYHVIQTTVKNIKWINDDYDEGYYISFEGVKGVVSLPEESYLPPHGICSGNTIYVGVDNRTGRTWEECYWKVNKYQYVGDKFQE